MSDNKNKVVCYVCECAYHGEHDSCQAKGITIEAPQEAHCSENTMCQTFISENR